MSNPVLIFVDPEKFRLQSRGRLGVRADGTIEDIEYDDGLYSIIIIHDTDDFDGFSFRQPCSDKPVFGVEHASRPVTGTSRLERLKEICSGYVRAHTFSHTEGGEAYELLRALLDASDNDARRAQTVMIVDFVASQDRWYGIVQWLMSEQIGSLRNQPSNLEELPHSSIEFIDEYCEGSAISEIIDNFLAKP